MTTTIQQASADKVGPNCTQGVTGTEDQLTQGALGEFYSKEAIFYHYNGLKDCFMSLWAITTNKSIEVPRIKKTIYKKSNLYAAILYFNALLNKYKKKVID